MPMHAGLQTILSTFRDGTVRRFLLAVSLAFWLGGFTFYGAVVVPTGMKVLGGHVRQGFITQQVTDWLNLASLVAIPIILWDIARLWHANGRVWRVVSAGAWVAMALLQIELFALHPLLDRLLDPVAREVLDRGRFDVLHRVYLMSQSVQWAAGVIFVWCAVAAKKIISK